MMLSVPVTHGSVPRHAKMPQLQVERGRRPGRDCTHEVPVGFPTGRCHCHKVTGFFKRWRKRNLQQGLDNGMLHSRCRRAAVTLPSPSRRRPHPLSNRPSPPRLPGAPDVRLHGCAEGRAAGTAACGRQGHRDGAGTALWRPRSPPQPPPRPRRPRPVQTGSAIPFSSPPFLRSPPRAAPPTAGPQGRSRHRPPPPRYKTRPRRTGAR